MRRVPLGAVMLALAGWSVASSTGDDAARAAARFAPEVRWDPRSALQVDFTCRGRKEFALLGSALATGTTMPEAQAAADSTEVVVAVFADGLARRPKLLRVGGVSPSAASLAAESLDHPAAAMKKELGSLPSGWRQSKNCKGLNLGDGATDSFHLYWHTALKGIAVWRL